SSLQYSDGTQWEFTYRRSRHNILSRIRDKNGRTLHIELHENKKNAGKIYYQYKEEMDLLVKYDYDDRSNLTHVYDRNGKAIQFVYDGKNQVEKRMNRNGMEYWWVYDRQGRVTETSGANGFQHGQMVYHPE
ncbi:hypothetical protein, partial [Bradyrhizobium sp. NBAIM08]|uniref:hypothetical protein n=1 Tax=Bradyrhizobium sp. NBAIM08 TaxID=2793815 RepID=UPI001CD7C72D